MRPPVADAEGLPGRRLQRGYRALNWEDAGVTVTKPGVGEAGIAGLGPRPAIVARGQSRSIHRWDATTFRPDEESWADDEDWPGDVVWPEDDDGAPPGAAGTGPGLPWAGAGGASVPGGFPAGPPGPPGPSGPFAQ